VLPGAQDGANPGSLARDFSKRVKLAELNVLKDSEPDPALLGGRGTFDLVKRESALNNGLRSPTKQMCCPGAYGQSNSV